MLRFLIGEIKARRNDAALQALARRLAPLDQNAIAQELAEISSEDDAYFICAGMLVRAALQECPAKVPLHCSTIIRLRQPERNGTARYVRCYAFYFLGAAKDDWAMAHKARQSSLSTGARPWLRRLLKMPFVPEFKRTFQTQVTSTY